LRIHLRTSNKPQSMQISNGTPLLPLLVQLLRREVHLRGRGEEEGGRGGPWAHFLLGELVSTPPRGPFSIGGACFNNPPGPIFYWGSLFQQPPGAHVLLGELVSTTPRGPFSIGGACFNNPPGPIFYWGSLVPQNGGAGTLNCENASARRLQILRNNSYLSDSDRSEWYLRFVFAEIR